MPVSDMFLWMLFFGLMLFCVLFGSFLGYKKKAFDTPCKVNKLSRDIPRQPWFLKLEITCLVGGLCSFL